VAWEIEISNCEVKAFKKRDGRITLHLRSHVIFHSKVPFSIEAYYRGGYGFIKLPGEDWTEFGSLWMVECIAHKYDGLHQVHEFGTSLITSKTEIKPCTAKIKFAFEFDFQGAQIRSEVERIAIIKKGRR
jgi:hypothetical protein